MPSPWPTAAGGATTTSPALRAAARRSREWSGTASGAGSWGHQYTRRLVPGTGHFVPAVAGLASRVQTSEPDMKPLLRYLSVLFLLLPPALPAWTLPGVGDYRFEPVAEGVWVMHGPLAEPNARNHGFMNNPAIVETEAGLVLIDPGSTLEVGRQVIAELRKVSERPVVAVIDTHIHGDHWLANQAVAEAWPKAMRYAHPAMIEQAESERAHAWLALLESATGGHSRGTRIVPPTQPLRDGDELVIGGHHFRVLA
ncbi:MAG TPA: MBL fold metallo-hydrolase, partial [Chromatiales bacterium]|nr:MBL fold metallo-hydrolase [Chromatiales bacterium]